MKIQLTAAETVEVLLSDRGTFSGNAVLYYTYIYTIYIAQRIPKVQRRKKNLLQNVSKRTYTYKCTYISL